MRCIHPIESVTSFVSTHLYNWVPNVVANMGAYMTIRARSKIGGAAFKIIYFRKETIQNQYENKNKNQKQKNKTKQNKKTICFARLYVLYPVLYKVYTLQKHKLVQNI